MLEEIIPKFEKDTGNKVAITWSTAALLTKRVLAGEQADALILIKGNIDTLQKAGKIMPGTDLIFSKSIFAVGIKAGAPKPDISTPEAFKKALLASKAVSYTNPATGGASGVYTAKQIEKMGITEQMKGKTKHPPRAVFRNAVDHRRSRHRHQFETRTDVGPRRRGGRAAARRHGLHGDL